MKRRNFLQIIGLGAGVAALGTVTVLMGRCPYKTHDNWGLAKYPLCRPGPSVAVWEASLPADLTTSGGRTLYIYADHITEDWYSKETEHDAT